MLDRNQNILETKKNQTKDENLKYIDEISKKKFEIISKFNFSSANKNKGTKSTPDAKEDSFYQSWGILGDEIKQMKKEFDSVVKLFKFFYTTQVYKLENMIGEKVTPMNINHAIKNLMTRIKRMVYVLDPEISIINFFDKKSKYHYQMIKGYWINDDGKRVRSLSRNIANADATINDLIMKFFKLNRKDVIVYEPDSSDGENTDLVIAMGRNKWTIKTTNMKREDFIRIYAMFELWKIYKDKYKLMD